MPLRVFVVDDCRDTTEVLRLLITSWGHEVQVANDGAAALALWPQLKPDVVFLDLSMPAIDGVAVASQMRQLVETKNCRLIALTGWADTAHRQQARDAGFDDYLLKPVEAKRLRGFLEQMENGKQAVVEEGSGAAAPDPSFLRAKQELDSLRQMAQKGIANLRRMRESN